MQFSIGLARAWTKLYTAGLGRELRTSRLAEIESDLWDQQETDAADGVSRGATAMDMFARLVTGLTDDIAWRVERRGHNKRRKTMLSNISANGWKQNALWALSLILAAFCLMSGVGIAIGMEDASAAEKVAYAASAFIAGLLIIVGFVAMKARPILASALIVSGAIVASVVFWWMFFIVPVVAAIVAWFAISRARRLMRENRLSLAPLAQ